jgi:hypothetical protein
MIIASQRTTCFFSALEEREVHTVLLAHPLLLYDLNLLLTKTPESFHLFQFNVDQQWNHSIYSWLDNARKHVQDLQVTFNPSGIVNYNPIAQSWTSKYILGQRKMDKNETKCISQHSQKSSVFSSQSNVGHISLLMMGLLNINTTSPRPTNQSVCNSTISPQERWNILPFD